VITDGGFLQAPGRSAMPNWVIRLPKDSATTSRPSAGDHHTLGTSRSSATTCARPVRLDPDDLAGCHRLVIEHIGAGHPDDTLLRRHRPRVVRSPLTSAERSVCSTSYFRRAADSAGRIHTTGRRPVTNPARTGGPGKAVIVRLPVGEQAQHTLGVDVGDPQPAVVPAGVPRGRCSHLSETWSDPVHTGHAGHRADHCGRRFSLKARAPSAASLELFTGVVGPPHPLPAVREAPVL